MRGRASAAGRGSRFVATDDVELALRARGAPSSTRSVASARANAPLERQPLEQLAGRRGLADGVQHVAAPDDALGDDRR